MRDLAGIAEINGPRAAELQAVRAQTVKDATEQGHSARSTQIKHGNRVEARAAHNGPHGTKPSFRAVFVEQPAIQDRIQDGIDRRDAFFAFWLAKNDAATAAGKPELGYGEARKLFSGGEDPEGALSYTGKRGEGLRAVPTKLESRDPAYHGQYRTVDGAVGTVWHTVVNNNDDAICYMTVEAALRGAHYVRAALATIVEREKEKTL